MVMMGPVPPVDTTMPAMTTVFATTLPPERLGLAATGMSIAAVAMSWWTMAQATEPILTALGNTTTLPGTAAPMPALTVARVPIPTVIIPQLRSIQNTVPASTQQAPTVQPVAPTSALPPRRVTVSPTEAGRTLMELSTAERKPVLPVATAPMNMPAIPSRTAHGQAFLQPGIRERFPALFAATVPSKRQPIPSPARCGRVSPQRSTPEPIAVPAGTQLPKKPATR